MTGNITDNRGTPVENNMIMRNSIISFLIFLSINSFGQNFRKSLEYAFKHSDKDTLRSILDNWNKNINSNENSVEDEVEKAVYLIFNEFYSPFHLKRIGASEWGDSLYFGKMAIVQNKIKYAIAEFPDTDTIMLHIDKDTISFSEFEKKFGKNNSRYAYYEELKYPKVSSERCMEIVDFRPETMLQQEQRLYLNSRYEKGLTEFLGNQNVPLGVGGIMNPARAIEESYERQKFLNNYLNIIYGHWGGYWHLETHPEVSLIVVNPSRSKAVLYFRLIYEGGEAYLENHDGKWILIESKLTWIE